MAKQPYVDTLDLLSKQWYLDKLRIVDVDPYMRCQIQHGPRVRQAFPAVSYPDIINYPYALPNSAWSKSETSFPAVSYQDIVNYLIFTKCFYTMPMEDMKAWKT